MASPSLPNQTFSQNASRLSSNLSNEKIATGHLRGLAPVFRRLFPERFSLDFTVVIPTYNGATRIGALLDRLKRQIGVEDLTWEIIVVDNNSTDNTREVIQHYQENWNEAIALSYEFEPQQGAGFARHLGAKVANSPIIGFLDDDNLPWINWVRAAYNFAQQHPQVGAFGGRIRGKFSAPPPANFDRIAALLALTDRGSKPIPYKPEAKILPPGAGLVVRRQAWLDNVPDERILSEKFGERDAGEDLEVVLYIQRAGWEIWYNAHIWMHHEIPENRLTKAYLVKLCRGIGLSRYHTRMLSFAPHYRPFVILPYALNDLRRILLHLIRYRKQVVTDTVAASEMMLYTASLVSPVYSWYRMGKRKVLPYWFRVLKERRA